MARARRSTTRRGALLPAFKAVVAQPPPPVGPTTIATTADFSKAEAEAACFAVTEAPLRWSTGAGRRAMKRFDARRGSFLDWLTDVAYWSVYLPGDLCPVKIPSASHNCAVIWKRIRKLVLQCARDLGLSLRDVLERAAAAFAVKVRPDASLDQATHVGFRRAYADGPEYPNFYDDTHTDWVYAWVRIRNWIDYLRHRPAQAAPSGVIAAGAFAAAATPYPEPAPLQTLGVPFAAGTAVPTWPVQSTDPRGCDVNYLDVDGVSHGLLFQRFGAPRGSSDWEGEPSRYHIGHDCIANPGDIVVAPESGVIRRIGPFYAGTDAMLLWTDSGLTINLGEVAPDSPAEFGVGKDIPVTQGQPVARIGTFNLDVQLPFHMLHFETFEGHQLGFMNWFDGDPQPATLRNPTDYLLRAACSLPPVGSFAVAPPSKAQLRRLGRAVMAVPSPAFPH